MTCTFVAPKQVTTEDKDGNQIITKEQWGRDDMVQAVLSGVSIACSEEHAAQVLRPQRHYQEVPQDVLDEVASMTDDPVIPVEVVGPGAPPPIELAENKFVGGALVVVPGNKTLRLPPAKAASAKKPGKSVDQS